MIKNYFILFTLMVCSALLPLKAQIVEIGGFLKLENVPENPNANNFLTINANGEVQQVGLANIFSLPTGMILLSGKKEDQVLLENNFSFIGATALNIHEKGQNNVNYGQWTRMDVQENVLSARQSAYRLWNGTEVIIYGGGDGSFLKYDGGRYNPTTNNWTLIDSVNGPKGFHEAMVSGDNKFYVFYYLPNNSIKRIKKYNLTTNAWTTVSHTNGPSIVSGVVNIGDNILNIAVGQEGKKLNISTETWSGLSMANSPSARIDNTYSWTGTEYIAWGGRAPQNLIGLNDGGAYNPVTNTWRTLASSPLSGRYNAHSFWTGSELIIWGGSSLGTNFYDGARYNPVTDSWTMMPNPGVSLYNRLAVSWTGTEMLLSDILTSRCFKYTPSTDSWTELNNNAMPPKELADFITVSMGNKQLIWGGKNAKYITFEGNVFDAGQAGYLPKKRKQYYLYKKM